MRRPPGIHPTPRETQVARFLGMGYTQQEIAELLEIAPESVNSYIQRLGGRIPGRGTAPFRVVRWSLFCLLDVHDALDGLPVDQVAMLRTQTELRAEAFHVQRPSAVSL